MTVISQQRERRKERQKDTDTDKLDRSIERERGGGG